MMEAAVIVSFLIIQACLISIAVDISSIKDYVRSMERMKHNDRQRKTD